MSVPISLIQMPEDPMKHILEYLDFPSILVLRKVCQDLRNFIDDTKPASHLTGIYIRVYPESICFSVFFYQSISKGTLMKNNEIQADIDYEQSKEGCSVTCIKEGNVKETIMEDEDFVTLFCKDFDIVLRHQKTILNQFSIEFISPDSTVKERVSRSVNKSLKSMSPLLKVESLYFAMNDHNEILAILPYIDPKPLEYIDITTHSEADNNVLNLDEIGQLKQWKQTEELSIRRFHLPYSSQNLKHLSKITFYLPQDSHYEELILLKEIFISSVTLDTIEIMDGHWRHVVRPSLIEQFGEPLIDTNRDEIWFFRIPDTVQFLKIKNQYYLIHFYRIEQSDVPQNAIISN